MAPDPIKRKLAAILSGDVQGYSRLMGKDEEGTIHTLKTHLELIFRSIQQYHGRIVSTAGDSFLAEFGSVIDAVHCAFELQRELRGKNSGAEEGQCLKFRMGINLGDVVEDGNDILGDGVNIAARLESHAEGGGILISGTVFDQVEGRLGLTYEYLGEQTFKNIPKPVRVYRILIENQNGTSPGFIDQHIQFCNTVDGVRIAYNKVGQGPFLVIPPGWISHLQLQWEPPSARDYLEKGTRNHTFLFYDKHGCGLSERDRTEFTIESEVRPLEAVVNHLRLNRFALFGFSQGGPVAIAYAIKYPERVSHLILYDTYAQGKNISTEEVKKSFISLVQSAWGIGSKAFADIFLPGVDAPTLKWFARLQREAATADMASKLLDLTYALDVTDILPKLSVPTLVMHRKGDKAIPFTLGREMASMIPNSRFVPLEGSIHIPFFGDADSVLRITADFLRTPPNDTRSI